MGILFGEEEKKALEYFDEAAKIALNSTCRRARCGSLIVRNDQIIGIGYNSPPKDEESQRRCSYSKESYNKKVTDKTCCMHAEQRAVIDALINNSEKIEGSRL